MEGIPACMTANEYLHFNTGDRPTELVRGQVHYYDFPEQAHGMVCAQILRHVYEHSESRDLGHLLCNNAGYIAGRNPDTVRGPDVSFFGYDQLPKGQLKWEFAPMAPHIAFEVIAFNEPPTRISEQVADHLAAGCNAVCVFHPHRETIQVFRPESERQTLSGDMELTLSDVLGPDFSVPAKKFFP